MDAAIVGLTNGPITTAGTKTANPLAAKAAVDSSFAAPSQRTSAAVPTMAAAANSRVRAPARRNPAGRVVDHAVTTLAGYDLKIESALPTLSLDRA